MASNDLCEVHIAYIQLLIILKSTGHVRKIFKKSRMLFKMATVKATSLHIKTGS